jgi:hypothetical protein
MEHRKLLVELLRGLYATLGDEPHPDLDALGRLPSIAFSFACGGMPLRLVHSEELPETRNLALIECCLGPIAPGEEERLFARLLDLNYRLCATNAAFSIDPEDGDIVFTCAFSIDGMKPGAFLTLVEKVEVVYAQWVLAGPGDGDATSEPLPMLSPELPST